MKFYKLIILVLLFSLNTPVYAKGVSSKEEELHRIPSIEVTLPDKGTMDLGYKTTGRYVFSILGGWIDNDGYVLIPKDSDNEYISLSAEDLQTFTALGLLPKDLPATPSMSIPVMLKGFSLWFIILGIGIFRFWSYLGKKKKKKEFNAILKYIDGHERTLIEVMGLMAHADGKLEDSEIQTIGEVHKQVSDHTINEEDLHKVLATLDKTQSTVAYAKKASMGMEKAEKIPLMQASILVASADGELSNKEMDFINELASGLELTKEDVVAILDDLGRSAES